MMPHFVAFYPIICFFVIEPLFLANAGITTEGNRLSICEVKWTTTKQPWNAPKDSCGNYLRETTTKQFQLYRGIQWDRLTTREWGREIS